ncbi:hypothetical protein MLD38_038749 [Melastoma candidum]|uniref:Uncharacterized protein n=1 Tax=Melastoma candidum TaxID=119954 RepID=A0ACB9L0K1_9MYRT|nr:hypothetical protein MLD38_038749 [Melastoma candidum]
MSSNTASTVVQNSSPRPRTSDHNNRGQLITARPIICQICNRRGHAAATCNLRYNRALENIPEALAALSVDAGATDVWYPDSGATDHMTSTAGMLHNFVPYSGLHRVRLGDGTGLSIAGVGQLHLRVNDHILRLTDVLYVPQLCHNLISIKRLCHDNFCSVEFDGSSFVVKDRRTGTELLRQQNEGAQYRLPLTTGSSKTALATIVDWHSRLCHPHSDGNQGAFPLLSPPPERPNHFICYTLMFGSLRLNQILVSIIMSSSLMTIPVMLGSIFFGESRRSSIVSFIFILKSPHSFQLLDVRYNVTEAENLLMTQCGPFYLIVAYSFALHVLTLHNKMVSLSVVISILLICPERSSSNLAYPRSFGLTQLARLTLSLIDCPPPQSTMMFLTSYCIESNSTTTSSDPSDVCVFHILDISLLTNSPTGRFRAFFLDILICIRDFAASTPSMVAYTPVDTFDFSKIIVDFSKIVSPTTILSPSHLARRSGPLFHNSSPCCLWYLQTLPLPLTLYCSHPQSRYQYHQSPPLTLTILR